MRIWMKDKDEDNEGVSDNNYARITSSYYIALELHMCVCVSACIRISLM